MNYRFGNPCSEKDVIYYGNSAKWLIICGILIFTVGEALPILLSLDFSFMKQFIKEE